VQQAAAAGCEWIHVDFGDELGPFYFCLLEALADRSGNPRRVSNLRES